MHIRNYCIALIFTVLGLCVARSQERHTEICIDFRVSTTDIDTTYLDNARHIQEILSFIEQINSDTTEYIIEVAFCGTASPEGNARLNQMLANGRLTSLERLIRSKVNISEDLIIRNDNYLPFDHLREIIANADISRKNDVLDIFDKEMQSMDYHRNNSHINNLLEAIQQLDNGRVWTQLRPLFLQHTRTASVVFITSNEKPEKESVLEIIGAPKKEFVVEEPVVEEEPVEEVVEEEVFEEVVEEVVEEDVVEEVVIEEPVEPAPSRHWYLKTNAVGLGMIIANVAGEIDLGEHWSVALPVYYTALNYFSKTTKFRTFAVYPELRYWPSAENQGFFTNVHLGVASFNVATNDELRYQNHEGKRPAFGGGLGVGYRLPLTKNERWHMEFVLGAGVYNVHYDTFYNVPNGKYIESIKKTYWGIDNAAINISYRFNLKENKR